MNEQQILGGRYRLIDIIGRGGMAQVWRAQDERLDREVAVKRLRVDLATDSTFQARFNREAQSAAGLNHPNIVSVYDTGSERDPATNVEVPYIVMELVKGETLRDLLRSGIRLSPETALQYATGVLDALTYSHRSGIIHRDIKPANVMLTDSGQIKVMDFGIARAVADTSATMTQTAAIIGTAQYLSPEQARGETVDNRSDIYSAGCLLYELFTGRPPFVGDSPVSVAYQHVRESPVPPSQINSAVSPDMDAIVMKALAKDPKARYQSAAFFRDDISRVLRGQAVTAVMPSVVSADYQPTQALSVDASAPTRAITTPAANLAASSTQTSGATRGIPADDYDDEIAEPEELVENKKHRPGAITWVLISLLVVLLAVLGFFVWRVAAPDPAPETVAVPRVIGFTEDAAKSELVNANLVAKVVEQEGSADTAGEVVAQDPSDGQVVELGSTVTITINTGPPLIDIPSGLVNTPLEDVQIKLTDAGFTNIATEAAPAELETSAVAPNTVLRVQPESGKVTADTKITLYISRGTATVPRVIGMGYDEAVNAFKGAGFTNVAAAKTVDTSNEAEDGKVIDQSPAAFGDELRTTEVVLTVGHYVQPEPTQQPSANSSSSSASNHPSSEPS